MAPEEAPEFDTDEVKRTPGSDQDLLVFDAPQDFFDI